MSLENLPKPTVKLVGEDGNAFAILGRTVRALRSVGWTAEQIASFRKEATSGDYDNLLRTVMKYCDEDDEDDY